MLTLLQTAHYFLHSSNQKPIHPTFPLNRLPLLPILNVFSSLTTVELFHLSRTSSKWREFIKTATLWKRLEINILFQSDFVSFCIFTGFMGHHIRIFPRKFRHNFYHDFSDEKEAKVWYSENSTYTYWNDLVLGIETIGNYLLEMFDKPKITITVVPNAVSLIEPVVHWLKNRNIRELTTLYVAGFSKSVGEMYLILEQFIVRGLLFINVELDYSRICWRLRNVDKVRIRKSALLTINDLLIIDSKFLYLHESSLTSLDLNRFLKNWKNGITNSRLKYFRMFSKSRLNKQQVLMDIEGVQRSRNEKRYYFLRHVIFEGVDNTAGGFDIERIDGIKATIHMFMDGFRIVVWPDFQGNMA